jgi:flagella basal body P-ring formation protein FlgA
MILLAALAATCIAIEGDRIRAADLAAAVPAFAALAPEETLGYAPAPGSRRMLSARELGRIAGRYGIALPAAPGLCVERAMERLTEERVLAALRTATGNPEARIELVEFSRYPVPRGDLEFTRAGYAAVGQGLALRQPRKPPSGAESPAQPERLPHKSDSSRGAVSALPVVWRGKLKYAGNRSVPVWARVRIAVSGTRLVAAEDLPAGRPIQASQLRMEAAELPLFSNPGLLSAEEAAGRAPRRTIRAGAPVPADILEAPHEIERGEMVSVEVTSGAAQLSLKAKAETAGRKGDLVMLRNPDSGRRFQGRVEGQGKVTIDAK